MRLTAQRGRELGELIVFEVGSRDEPQGLRQRFDGLVGPIARLRLLGGDDGFSACRISSAVVFANPSALASSLW